MAVESWGRLICRSRVPPLPRDPLRQTSTTPSRGRGGGGGTTSCRGLGCGPLAARRDFEKPLIRSSTTFPPGGKAPLAVDLWGRLICRSRVPPLPRDPLRQTRTTPSRGRGGGGGTASCRGLGCGSLAARRDFEKPLIRSSTTFPPGGKDPLAVDSFGMLICRSLVPPLPRDKLRQTRTTPSRGRGGVGGITFVPGAVPPAS